MKTTEVLYSFWAGTRKEQSEVIESWKKIDRMIQASIPEEQRQEFIKMLIKHCCRIEYDGFTAGFKTAAELWKELD